MKFPLIKISIAILFSMTFYGCKKFVEINPPVTELVTTSVFNNNASATAAMTGIYTQMFDNSESYGMSENSGILSDELTSYSTQLVQVQLYRNAMTAVSAPGPWVNAYSYIYQVNIILAALTNNNNLSLAVINQLKGEALFVRAFWNFYLANCYGNAPLVTTTDYTVNESISSATRSTIYKQIVADLQAAEGLLNGNYVDATDTAITTDRVRPNKASATALLARVYLYIGNWAGADSAATAVIQNSALYSLDSLDNVFLANSTETIWQIATPSPNNFYTTDGNNYILTAAPSIGSNINSNTISPQLLASFEAGDGRLSHWIDSFSVGNQAFYFPYKYKVNIANYPGSTVEATMVLRLAEQFLIRAEGEAQQNQISAAVTDLNTIRGRAGLGGTSAGTQSALLSAILHERQVELFTEWGHRWFDLVRTNMITSVMSLVTNNSKSGKWIPADSLYPIPQSEIKIDANLSQNEGY